MGSIARRPLKPRTPKDTMIVCNALNCREQYVSFEYDTLDVSFEYDTLALVGKPFPYCDNHSYYKYAIGLLQLEHSIIFKLDNDEKTNEDTL